MSKKDRIWGIDVRYNPTYEEKGVSMPVVELQNTSDYDTIIFRVEDLEKMVRGIQESTKVTITREQLEAIVDVWGDPDSSFLDALEDMVEE